MGWNELAQVAERNLAIVDTRDAAACDVSPAQILGLRRKGVLEDWHPGVYGIAGVPRDLLGRRELAASRAAGPLAVVSHESAAILHGCRDVARPPLVHLLVPRGHECRVRGAFVHSATWLPRAHLASVGPIPVTLPERALAERSVRIADERLARAVYDPWRLGLISPMVLGGVIDGLPRLPGRRRFQPILASADPRLQDARSVPEIDGFVALNAQGSGCQRSTTPCSMSSAGCGTSSTTPGRRSGS